MKNIFLILLAFSFVRTAVAQPEFGLHFMRNTAQAARTNPALIPGEGIIIQLPNFVNSLEISGPTFGQLIGKNAAGKTIIDLNKALPELEQRNTLRENLDIETLGVIFGAGPVRFQVHHAMRFGGYINYPKSLPQLIWQGNAQFIGERIDLSNDLQIAGYNEFGLGGSFKLAFITLGARVKILSGIGDVSTSRNEASLLTSDDIYQLEFAADYQVNTSSYVEYNGFDDFQVNLDFGDFKFENVFTKNSGYAFDFGANIELNRLNLAASIVDIGSIKWTSEVKNYRSNGTFVYDGLDISQALGGDSIVIGDALDTLEQIFQIEESSVAYSTDLPSKFYLSATYELTDTWLLGAAFFSEHYRGEAFNGVALSARAGLLNWLSAGATYAIYRDTYTNLGLNTTIKAGPVQILAAADNVLAVFDPDRANFANMRLGMNVIF